MKKIVTLVIMMVLLIAAPASSSPTEVEAFAIADRWAAQFPQHENHCSGGRMTITYEDTSPFLGWANGWIPNGLGGYRGDYTRCSASIMTGLKSADRCWVIAHELMHFVIGPEHVGPLDPRNAGAVECYRQPNAKSKRKRSRREIARSIKFRKTMARIHDRQANG